jgi:hypothetical protein
VTEQPANEPADRAEPGVDPKPSARPDPDEPVLPDVSGDDRDEGWGRDPDGRRDEEWYRRERPPHHE